MRTVDGRLICLAGASRSGKTAYARELAGTMPRVLAWDIEGQWARLPGWQRLDTAAQLAAAADSPGPGRYAFVSPAGADPRLLFDFWAKCAFHAADTRGPLWLIAEELADVTHAGKAPGHWGILLRRGLKRGASIIAISQRWAEADKTAIGNASELVIFRQSSADDVRYLSRKTRVPADQIDGLRPLEFVRYDCHTQKSTAGRLRF